MWGFCPALYDDITPIIVPGIAHNSKKPNITLKIGEELKFQNLLIKVLTCYNSKFDDDPEVTAYMQVKDLTIKDKDKVFFFNDWTFASSPSIRPFDHPVYDIWLKKCYN